LSQLLRTNAWIVHFHRMALVTFIVSNTFLIVNSLFPHPCDVRYNSRVM